jgi:hypothetical protein
MAQKRTLNERRLTKRQVQELISSGARPRPDLSAAFESTLLQPLVYELAGERYLLVFGAQAPGLGGRGDIYAADDFHRFVRWTAKVEEDARHGRQSSVGHWAYYSVLKERLIANIDTLVVQLRSTMSQTADALDFSYRSLDVVSGYVEGIGVERAQQDIYDHLVAYVGEVLRLRIQGRWEVNDTDRQPRPYLVGAMHDPVMPINVVWGQLSGLAVVDLRTAAANEVRRARKPPGLVGDGVTSVRAAAPKGALATVPADAYEVTKRWADGRPWFVIFKGGVEVGGVPCRAGEAWFGRKGDLIGATLSREWLFGTRRFGAGCFFRYYARDGRLNDVKLGADQVVDGLPCLGGTLVWFHPNQRASSLHLASDRDVDGIPCASGANLTFALNFHRNGRLAAAVLAREHIIVGREFPRGAHISLDEKGHLRGVTLQEDRDIDGIPVKAGAPEGDVPRQRPSARAETGARPHARGPAIRRGNVSALRSGRTTHLCPAVATADNASTRTTRRHDRGEPALNEAEEISLSTLPIPSLGRALVCRGGVQSGCSSASRRRSRLRRR